MLVFQIDFCKYYDSRILFSSIKFWDSENSNGDRKKEWAEAHHTPFQVYLK